MNTDYSTRAIEEEPAATIVRCIEEALGDDILADERKNGLLTNNGSPGRKWDFINTNLYTKLDQERFTITETKIGSWKLVVLYDKLMRCIYTLMREKRFEFLRKQLPKKAKKHYIEKLAVINKKSEPVQQLMDLGPNYSSNKNADLSEAQELLCTVSVNDIQRYVLVLMDSVGYQLISVKTIELLPNLETVVGSEQDWSKYISVNESAVVDTVVAADTLENQLSGSLKLTNKALKRQKTGLKKKTMDDVAARNS